MQSGFHRLHALRPGDPLGNRNFVAIFGVGVFEAWVVQKESYNITVTWAHSTGEGLNIAACQGPEPAPAASQRSRGARFHFSGDWFTSEKAPGQGR